MKLDTSKKKKLILDKKTLSHQPTEKEVCQLWGDYVRARAGWKCEYPGCKVMSTQLHPHHFFSRRYASIKYDPMNGIALCAHHHTLGKQAAHLDPMFKDIIISNGIRSELWLEELIVRRNEIAKDNNDLRKYYKAILEEKLNEIILKGDEEWLMNLRRTSKRK